MSLTLNTPEDQRPDEAESEQSEEYEHPNFHLLLISLIPCVAFNASLVVADSGFS